MISAATNDLPVVVDRGLRVIRLLRCPVRTIGGRRLERLEQRGRERPRLRGSEKAGAATVVAIDPLLATSTSCHERSVANSIVS